MSLSKTIIILLAGIIAIAIDLIILQLILKKVKKNAESESKLKISFAIWFSTLFFALSIINYQSISFLNEAIDNIYKINPPNIIKETAKAISLFIGLGVVWFVIWFYISNVFAVLVVGKRKDSNEMESDNRTYFLIKGFITIGFIIALMPIFVSLIRTFIPSIEIPFYH